jgi:hypothetical protein
MSDILAGQRVRLWDGSNDVGFEHGYPVFIKLTDGTLDLNIVKIGDAYGSTPVVIPIAGKYEATPTTYNDGDAVPLLTDENGRLLVGNVAIDYSKQDDSAFGIATDNVAAIGALANETSPDSVNEGDIGIPRMTLDRKLLVRVVGDVDGQRWNIDSNGYGPIDIASQSLTAIKISKDSNANSSSNPIWVKITETAEGDEIHDYSTTTSLAKGNSTNHDYTITSGKTFSLESILVAASGAMKAIIQVGPVASLTTKAVAFTSGAKPTEQLYFKPPIVVPSTSTGTIRVILRNDDNQSMDVYSTIMGSEA